MRKRKTPDGAALIRPTTTCACIDPLYYTKSFNLHRRGKQRNPQQHR
ncbi:hypothetical protein CKO_03690 [Citrobacter koseri ATCC BAA-895]|uniref:Uncharacterized protein n=1 Tax=Citrobacter koseri (strain ATCC BAA-895 / CDC 4225-83 / SGSC4696) TaxID=290338 RepID=A8AMQ4_CITK8|nr:hypothetical protein CKO_03690 [Citrobacter koseri ATCC BAA-895]